MPVFILLIKVRPDNDNPQVSEIAGAYVNCFVERETFDLAEEKALKFLKKNAGYPSHLKKAGK